MNSIEEIIRALSLKQSGQLNSLIWLLGTGPRGSGRTYLMALAFIIISIKEQRYVKLFSHTPNENVRQVLLMVENILRDCPELELTIKREPKSFNQNFIEISVKKSGMWKGEITNKFVDYTQKNLTFSEK